MATPDPNQRFELPVSWVGYDEVPIVYANQFLLQIQPEGSFVMAVGQSTPPALLGTLEEIAAQVSQVEFVPVRTLARVALTEQKARDLVAVLEAALSNSEKLRELIDPRGGA
jgi:hypothetical protein